MKRSYAVAVFAVFALAASGLTLAQNQPAAGSAQPAAPSRNLEIYWIDTEGGAATLIVSPSGESMLIDTGVSGDRDATRINAAARAAGLSRSTIS